MALFRQLLRRWLWTVATALLIILLPIVPSLAIAQPSPRILPIAQNSSAQLPALACFPEQMPGITDPANQLAFELVGRVAADQREYQMYQVLRKQQPNTTPFSHLVQITNGQCQSLATNARGDESLYLHQVVPIPVARQIALAQLQHSVARAGGAQAFQARLNQGLQQVPKRAVVMPEENVWAFEQQQLTLPDTVQIVHAPA